MKRLSIEKVRSKKKISNRLVVNLLSLVLIIAVNLFAYNVQEVQAIVEVNTISNSEYLSENEDLGIEVLNSTKEQFINNVKGILGENSTALDMSKFLAKDFDVTTFANKIDDPTVLKLSDEAVKFYADVQAGQWYTNNVGLTSALGLFQGDANQKFNPSANVTIAEYITVLVRTLGITLNNGSANWYDNYINKAIELKLIMNPAKTTAIKEYGLTLNCDKGIYNVPITRRDAAALVERLMQYMETGNVVWGMSDKAYQSSGVDKDMYLDQSKALGFKSISEVKDIIKLYDDYYDLRTESHAVSVAYLYKNGIMQGSKGLFNPSTNLSRAEFATIAARVIREKQRLDVSDLQAKIDTRNANQKLYNFGGSKWVDVEKLDTQQEAILHFGVMYGTGYNEVLHVKNFGVADLNNHIDGSMQVVTADLTYNTDVHILENPLTIGMYDSAESMLKLYLKDADVKRIMDFARTKTMYGQKYKYDVNIFAMNNLIVKVEMDKTVMNNLFQDPSSRDMYEVSAARIVLSKDDGINSATDLKFAVENSKDSALFKGWSVGVIYERY